MITKLLPSNTDRSLAFADGVFTTFRIQNQQIIFEQAHFIRLQEACQRLAIAFCADEVKAAFSDCLVEAEKLKKYSLITVGKIIISAGNGGQGYTRQDDGMPNIYYQVKPLPIEMINKAQLGLSLGICQQRIPYFDAIAGLKTTNALVYVLATNEYQSHGWDEALLLDNDDNIIETCTANVWVEYMDGSIWTSDLSRCGVDGVFRQQLLQWFKRQKVNVNISHQTIDTLLNALSDNHSVRTIMITNSVYGLRKVNHIADYSCMMTSELIINLQAAWQLVCLGKNDQL